MDESLIYHTALARVDPAERADFLARACGADVALRQRIERALQEATDPTIEPTLAEIEATRALPAPLFPFLAPSPEPDSLGRLDKYEVVDVLGQGGMGVVLKAFDPDLERFVALKVLPCEFPPPVGRGGTRPDAETARQRFDREVRAVAAIEHDHVVGIHAVFPQHDPPYFAMPYIEGPSLQQLLDRKAAFSVAEIVRIGREAAAGLAAAHARGVIHRDIKPANLLLEQPRGRVKITDFGLARGADDVSLTAAGLVAGTPLFMSPEQARGDPLDERSDLFSLGGVLYALCTGRPPFMGSIPAVVLRQVCDAEPAPIRSLNPAIPEWLAALVTRLLNKNPEKRYPSARAVAELLASPPPEQPPRPARRWLLGGAILSGLLAAVLLPLVLRGRGKQDAGPLPPPARPVPLAERACPADGLAWETVPRSLRAALGCGDPDRAPRAVVAILADPVRRPRAAFSSAAYRPDGAVVAVGDLHGDLQFVDTVTGAIVGQPVKAHADQVRALAYRPDGQRLASGGFDNLIKIWNPAARQAPRAIRTVGQVKALAYSRDGKRIIAAIENVQVGHRTEVWIWNADTGAEVRHRVVSAGAPHALALHPAGTTVAVVCYDKMVYLLDAETLAPGHTLQGHTKPLLGVAFSPDGRWLYSCGEDCTVRAWNVATGAPVAILPAPDKVIGVAPLPNSILAAACINGLVLGYSLKTGKAVCRLEEPGESLRFALASPDGQTLLVGGWGGSLTFRDTASAQDRHPFAGHYSQVHGVAFSPDGRLLATCGADRIIALWDVATGQVRSQLLGHRAAVGGVAFSPDGKWLASCSLDRTVRIWNVATGKLLHQIEKDIPTGLPCVTFSPDGSLLAACSLGGTVHVWNRAGQAVRTWKASGQSVMNLAFSPGGGLLATVSTEGGLRLWATATWAEGCILTGHEAATRSLAFHPAGRLVAGAGTDGRIRFWDVTTGALVREFAGPRTPVDCLAFRADGRLLVAYAPVTGLLQWWDLDASPPRTRSLRLGSGHADLQRMSLSPEGRHVALASPDRAAYLVRLAVRGAEPAFDP